MSEIDWSKAPEGCTHYIVGSTAPYEKRAGDNWWYWSGKRKAWIALSNIGDQRLVEGSHAIIPRPSPAWSGEGLPPVGTVCLHKNNGLEKMRVFAIDGKWAAVSSEFSKFWCPVNELISIRTPEQIAADEREKAIEDIFAAGLTLVNVTTPYEIAAMLYDAGYRKREVE